MRTLTALTGALLMASMVLLAQPASFPIVYRPTAVYQLGVANLDRAIAFYTQTLGFRLTERRDDLKFAHIATRLTGLEIGLNEVENPRGTGGAVLNIGVADVAAARKTLEARGVKFTGETVVIPGKVALAGFTDLDGNVLRFAGLPPKTP